MVIHAVLNQNTYFLYGLNAFRKFEIGFPRVTAFINLYFLTHKNSL